MNKTTVTLAMLISMGGLTRAETGGRVAEPEAADMQYIKGGTFQMGDAFDEGVRFATPVHEVTVSSFYLNRCEVTVEEFAAFVKDAGYVTSAEKDTSSRGPADENDQQGARLASRGAWLLDTSPSGTWSEKANWKDPQFEQSPKDPVTCVSWTDAVSYCNWLSTKEGLPISYDVATGNLLDAEGRATTDVTKARGYRLPTEAEWEFAARERGKKIRFGNGQNVARSDEMNFNAAEGEFAFAVTGEFRRRTTTVGSFKPNGLGLFDMSGNVWEWCSDIVGPYTDKPQTNPYQQKGLMGARRAARGGPWVGDASLARVSVRLGWVAEDRCNNIGFRIARSE